MQFSFRQRTAAIAYGVVTAKRKLHSKFIILTSVSLQRAQQFSLSIAASLYIIYAMAPHPPSTKASRFSHPEILQCKFTHRRRKSCAIWKFPLCKSCTQLVPQTLIYCERRQEWKSWRKFACCFLNIDFPPSERDESTQSVGRMNIWVSTVLQGRS